MTANGGLAAVIGASIVMVATAYLVITYARPLGQIAGYGVKGVDTLARSWQT